MSPSAWSPEADLPPERPLAMPEQRLDETPAVRAAAPRATPLWRRAFLIGGAGVIGVVASCGVARPLAVDGFDIFDQATVLLCLSLFAWIAFGFLSSLVGLVLLVSRRGRGRQGPAERLPARTTAVLIPVYNEEVAPLAARIARMTASLDRIGAGRLFDFFVLSDSRPEAEAAERAAVRALRASAASAIHYRRRPVNAARKPGNIADWVRRFGGGYEGMIVLDADSVMSGRAMARLAVALEDEPGLGLVQTNPQLTGGATLFARWQQFATAFYGPIASAGLEWWSGDEATFWGHNAIVRVRAFAEGCGLPRLSGPEPLGGHIMSHDMVEAALLRRRGWGARLMLLDEGSYEECPPTLVDHGVRDRRWCQGNLQHLRLLETAGLHWVSRLQLFMGASAYLTSPLWLLMLVSGLAQALRTGTPMADLGAPAWLIALTVVLLFGTRAMALAWAAFEPRVVRSAGGWRAIAASVAAELPLSIITAPIAMMSQSIAVAEILAGRPSGWKPQRRQADGLPLAHTLDHYRWHMLLGLLFWTVSLSEVGGAAWELPVALGLLGAPFIASFTSRVDIAAAAARHGIFVADPGTPERELPAVPAPLTGWRPLGALASAA